MARTTLLKTLAGYRVQQEDDAGQRVLAVLGEVRRVAVRSHIRRGHDQVAPWWRAYDPQGVRLLCPTSAGYRLPLRASMVQTRKAAVEALERAAKGDRADDPYQGEDG